MPLFPLEKKAAFSEVNASPNLSLAFSHLLFLGALIWLLVTAAYHAALTVDGKVTGIDFEIFYHAAQRLNQGLPLYQPTGELYAYSPLLAELMRPLAHFSVVTALKLQFACSAACLVLSVFVYGAAARMTWRDAAPLGLMLLVAFRCWPTTMNFALGQINFLMLLLLCGLFWAESRRKPVLFGILIGIAALFKIWMLGLLLFPLLRRQWPAVSAALGLCAAGFLALFTLVGWQEFPLFVRAGLATGSQVSRISITHSLPGFAHLHFQTNGLLDPLARSPLLFGLVVIVGLALIGCGFWTVGKRRLLSGYESRLSLGLVAVSVLLLLPPCQNEYLVLCLPLLWTLIAPADAEVPQRSRLPSLPLMACGWLAYLLLSRGWGPYAPVPPNYQHGLKTLVVSTAFFGLSILWLVGLLALRRSQAEESQAGAEDHFQPTAPGAVSTASRLA